MTQTPPVLAGSPYSFSDGRTADRALAHVASREGRIRRRLNDAHDAIARNLRQGTDVNRFQRSREIYESNRIENLGPSLSRTDTIIQENSQVDIRSPIFQKMLEQTIDADKQLVEVLGLNAARTLAIDLATTSPVIITATDLRGLHAQICVGEWFAGSYKTYPNAIEGSTHQTSTPVDTPLHMSQLADWLTLRRDDPGTLSAAVAHGWLAHIHPFADGNGRLSRILMNFLLMRAGLPPAIIRHDTDKGKYLAALAESDKGGDIFPLVQVLLDAQDRFVKEISRPAFLSKLVREQMERLSSTAYEAWSRAVDEFMGELAAALVLRFARLVKIDDVTADAFESLVAGDSSGNTWAAWVNSGRGSLLLWFGYSSSVINGSIPGSFRYPSMTVSVRNDVGAPVPYRRATVTETGGVSEILILPDIEHRVYLRAERRVRFGAIPDSADEIANDLVRGLQYLDARA